MNTLRAHLAPALVAVLLTAATAGIYLGHTRDRAGVWLSAPLDDTFIHFQYAKQLARGHVLQFNDGDSPSTGATSLLYLFLLAPGWLAGLRGIHLLIWAWIANGALHVLGGLALFSCLARLTRSRPLAYTGLCAFLLCGPMLWGAYSGMEIALFSTVMLLTLEAATRLEAGDETARRALLVRGSLLALTRPEGMVLAGGLTLWLLWRHLGEEGSETWPRRLWRGRALLWPLGAGLLVLLLLLLLTGRMATNAAIKSHLANLAHDPGHYLETSVGWLPLTLQILLEKWPAFVQPLTTALGLAGLAFWAANGRWRRPGSGALALGWVALLTLFYALAVARRDHFDRYYLPYLGLIIIAVWWTLGWLGRRFPAFRVGPVLLSLLLLLFMMPDTLLWARRFGDNCRDLAQQHFQVAAWLRDHTPAGSRIAVNDAGAIPYLSGRYTYDIVGLAHNAFYQRKNHMPGSNAPVWEVLETLAPRPDHVVAYPEWIPDLHGLPLFEQLKRFPLERRTIVANDVKVIWKLRWERLIDAHALQPSALLTGQRVVDRLDVADLASEAEHRYRRLDRGAPEGAVRHLLEGQRVLVDGGRLVRTGEAFALRSTAGRPATLLLRTAGPGPDLDLRVEVNGREVGQWRAPRPAGLYVLSFSLPAAVVTTDRLALRLTTSSPYQSYHYWLAQ